MRPAYFVSDLLARVTDAGRNLTSSDVKKSSLIEKCLSLVSGQGEATGLAVAREVLDSYAKLDEDAKRAFFVGLRDKLGVDVPMLQKSIADWHAGGDDASARQVHFASEPKSQELIRRLNRAPNGTRDVVAMRADLLKAMRDDPSLKLLDGDFRHLFASWFNRGFLELRSIDWSTSADVLEKIITYEAVHAINGWNDLRRRVAAKDRRLYGFFHPALSNEPLIFVEVALVGEIPDAIGPILAEKRKEIDPAKATTAVFYSISNCQAGLRGVSFGNFLIKQVVEELRSEFASLKTFVTLSPVPGLRRWAEDAPKEALSKDQRAAVAGAGDGETLNPLLGEVAARYLAQAKAKDGGPLDPVARFHLGNGARLERVNLAGDTSDTGRANSWGIMVNYLYDLGTIERNHEALASRGEVIISPAVRRLVKTG